MLVIKLSFRKRSWKGKYGKQKICDIVVVKFKGEKSGFVIEKIGFISKVFGEFQSFAFLDLDRVGFWLNCGAKIHKQVLLIIYWIALYEIAF